jgi:two-component system chemotaxis response regulator CheY
MTKQILVVDDSFTVREQVALALREAGYDVLEASDGTEALRSIQASPKLAMMICDVNMPNMNGLELLAALREQSIASFPVIMLTSEGRREQVALARSLGALAWIIKPVAPELIVATVNKLTA